MKMRFPSQILQSQVNLRKRNLEIKIVFIELEKIYIVYSHAFSMVGVSSL